MGSLDANISVCGLRDFNILIDTIYSVTINFILENGPVQLLV